MPVFIKNHLSPSENKVSSLVVGIIICTTSCIGDVRSCLMCISSHEGCLKIQQSAKRTRFRSIMAECCDMNNNDHPLCLLMANIFDVSLASEVMAERLFSMMAASSYMMNAFSGASSNNSMGDIQSGNL